MYIDFIVGIRHMRLIQTNNLFHIISFIKIYKVKYNFHIVFYIITFILYQKFFLSENVYKIVDF